MLYLSSPQPACSLNWFGGGSRGIRAIEARAAENVRRLDPISSIEGVDQQLSFICRAHVIIAGVMRDDDYAVMSAPVVERRAGKVD